jgi:hypothetical protein
MVLPTFQELMRPSLELSKSKLGFTEAVGILADQLKNPRNSLELLTCTYNSA